AGSPAALGRLRRAVPARVPGGRRPRAQAAGRRLATDPGAAGDRAPGARRGNVGERTSPGGQRGRRPDAPAARSALAASGCRARGTAARAHRDDGRWSVGRHRRAAGRPMAGSSGRAGLGGADRPFRLASDPQRAGERAGARPGGCDERGDTAGGRRPPAAGDVAVPERRAATMGPTVSRVLAVRLDSLGDVLLCGPAVRALAHRFGAVDLLASPAGEPAARLLPEVGEVLVFDAPWSGFEPPPVDAAEVTALVRRLRRRRYDRAVVFTSYPQ